VIDPSFVSAIMQRQICGSLKFRLFIGKRLPRIDWFTKKASTGVQKKMKRWSFLMVSMISWRGGKWSVSHNRLLSGLPV